MSVKVKPEEAESLAAAMKADMEKVTGAAKDVALALENFPHDTLGEADRDKALQIGVVLMMMAKQAIRVVEGIATLRADYHVLRAERDVIEKGGSHKDVVDRLRDMMEPKIVALTSGQIQSPMSGEQIPIPQGLLFYDKAVLGELQEAVKQFKALEEMLEYTRKICEECNINFEHLLDNEPEAVNQYSRVLAQKVGAEVDEDGKLMLHPNEVQSYLNAGGPPEQISPHLPTRERAPTPKDTADFVRNLSAETLQTILGPSVAASAQRLVPRYGTNDGIVIR